jgi:hypothetical protein
MIFCVTGQFVLAQIVIGTGTQFAASSNPQITIATTGDVVNNSTFDFGPTNLRLLLTGSSIQDIVGNWNPDSLLLAGDGIKFLKGNLTVTGKIRFVNGVVRIDNQGKFLFTGSGENILVRNAQSYVDGIFYQTGGGNRFFPVGRGAIYAPLAFENMATNEADTVGVQVTAGPSGIEVNDFSDGSVAEVSKDHFWEIVTGETTHLSDIQAVVKLSLNNINMAEGSELVIQSEMDGSDPKNLSFQFEPEERFVKSLRDVTAPKLVIGRVDEVIVTIYQLITPYGSPGVNDVLKIDNIGSFTHKKVTLMDRYGVLVKIWGDGFDTEVEAFDFKKLSPGSYICIAEYGNSGDDVKTQTQMVTVLRSN